MDIIIVDYNSDSDWDDDMLERADIVITDEGKVVKNRCGVSVKALVKKITGR